MAARASSSPPVPPSADTATPDAPLAEARFEVLVAELDAIVTRLERGEVPLDAALEAFERGMVLARAAGGLLDHAEARLAVLSEDARMRGGTRETPMAFPSRDGSESE